MASVVAASASLSLTQSQSKCGSIRLRLRVPGTSSEWPEGRTVSVGVHQVKHETMDVKARHGAERAHDIQEGLEVQRKGGHIMLSLKHLVPSSMYNLWSRVSAPAHIIIMLLVVPVALLS